jgi:Acyl-CoA reductase (LuxC)
MKLTDRPVRSIVRAIAGAAERWSDGDFSPRVRLLDAVAARTGYSHPVVEYALDRIFFSLDERSIQATIARELGSLDALDGFVERGSLPRARALPLGSVCIVSSRTTIGVALVPAIFALCAKCDVLVKDRDDGLVAAFFSTLREELDEFESAAHAKSWDGRNDAEDLRTFDGVVAFGSDATLAQIRSGLAPLARFVPYGSKASAGYVGRDALTTETAARTVARGAARDLVLYESEGCLSLHALFVERGGAVTVAAFATLLAAEIERAAVEFPPGTRSAHAGARLAQRRDLAAFRAASGSGAVYSDANASYLAVLDPPASEPPAFLPRALGIHAVDAPSEAAAYLERHRIPLEAVAIAGARADIVALAVAAGAARIAAFGDLQSPALGGYHGGRPRIAEFVRWIADETA